MQRCSAMTPPCSLTNADLYYLQARYYDPETARFVSRVPDGGDFISEEIKVQQYG